MKLKTSSFRSSRDTISLFAALTVLGLLPYSGASAQAPPVPSQFQAIYSSLDTYLVNFNTTLAGQPASQLSMLNAGNLKNADANAGPPLVNPGTMTGIQLQLQELKAMGMQAIMVEVGFPMLYQPFLTSQGQSYTQWVAFYQQIGAMIHAAGMKVVVENDTLLVNDDQANWSVAAFYATLNWTEYQQARAQTALTIAQTMQPDYLVVLEEPITEADDSGQSEANTTAGSVSLLTQILASVQQSGVPNMQVGAGVGTSQTNALSFIQAYVALPLNFIDFHIYPINLQFLPIALQIASTAAAAGLPVSMTECWMWKVADSELGVLSPDEVRARDPFSFWEPLDALFIQTMQNMGQHTQMLFMDPFNTETYSAYLAYGPSTENLSPSAITSQESTQASANEGLAMYTSTATSYYTSVVAPPDKTPPAVPPGVNGSSDNATTATITWDGSTDNVGVAGYYLMRNGSVIATTASLYYQDSGLTSSTTYTYNIEAFDLGANISTPSTPISVTTKDVTPPTTPGGVAATATSCQKVMVTWSPSTDNTAIGSYIVFWGLSPAALVQVGRASATGTVYPSSSLTAGTANYYGVEAVDTSGNVSAMSAIVSATTPMPPAPPASVVATAASTTRIGLTWSASVGGGLPIQNYHVYRGTTASSLSQVAVALGTVYSDTAVTEGTTYYYAVEAADTGADLSPMSAIASATPLMPPAAPTSLVATAASMTRIGLTWSASVSGGLPIQNYHVYRGTTASSLSQVAVTLGTVYSDSTVTEGTTYYYAVQAADSGADLSPMSATVSATPLLPPAAPTGLVATAASTTRIGLTWSASVSGGLPIQNYHVYRGTTASSLSQLAVTLGTVYNDSAVTEGTTYYYAVQAADSSADLSPMSATVSATPLPMPSPPTALNATSPTKTEVSLTWSAGPSGMPLSSYSVFRGSSPSNLTSLRVVAATQASTNDYTVVAGATYYYAVQEKDTGGNLSPMSETVSVTTP